MFAKFFTRLLPILFDDKIEIFYKYPQNNNPDEISQEIRRDFCLPSKRRLSVTHRHIIYTGDITASRGT